MSDLIDREDVIEAIFSKPAWHGSDGSWYHSDDIRDAIGSTQSADRPKGEWIRTGRTNIYGGIEVQCSHCKDKVTVQHLEDEWFCRHCGADMGMKGADDDLLQTAQEMVLERGNDL